MNQNYDLTIIIPVFNEAENIRQAIEKIAANVFVPHTINIVYDTDNDTTISVVQDIQKKRKNIRLLKNKYGRGALNAIKTGLEEASGTYAVVTMADLSDPPSVINKMFTIAEEKTADIVCASRYMKGGRQIGGPVLKGLLSRVAGLTLHWFAGVPTHDATNSFKLYRTSFLRKETIESTGGFELGIELVAKAYVHGYKIHETPTVWADRIAGKSRFKLSQWLPNYLHWYFYAFKKKHNKGPDFGAIIKKYRGQFIQYVCAGFICALVNWAVFYILHYLHTMHYLVAGIFAFLTSVTVNYFLSKLIFFSRGTKRVAEFFLVLLASAAALSFDLFVMYILVERLSFPAMTAKILGTGSAFFINYFSRQFFIFQSRT
jgi:putative flippase GtrA